MDIIIVSINYSQNLGNVSVRNNDRHVVEYGGVK